MNDPIRFFLALTLFLLLVQTGFVVQYFRSDRIRSDAETLVLQDFRNASFASRFFREKEGRWPSGWEELLSADLLDRIPEDPWTQEQYQWIQARNAPPIFLSWGADRLPGGEGLNADVIGRELYDQTLAKRD